MLDITRNLLLRCQLSYFYQANIKLHQYDSFFRFTLSLCGDININPSPTTVNDNKIPLNIWNRPLWGSSQIGAGAKSFSLPKICHTYSAKMKLGTIIPHLKKSDNTLWVLLTLSFFLCKSPALVISRNTDIDYTFIHNFNSSYVF